MRLESAQTQACINIPKLLTTLHKRPVGKDWPDSLELLNHQVLLPAPDLLGDGTQGSLILDFLLILIPIFLDLILTEEQTRSTEMPFSQGILGQAWRAGSGQAGVPPSLCSGLERDPAPSGEAFRETAVPGSSQGAQQEK